MDKYLEAEKELAELMGFTEVEENPELGAAGRMLAFKGNAPVTLPKWTRDDATAFQLMVGHQITVEPTGDFIVYAHYGTAIVVDECYANHPDKATAVRYAIVQAVIERLKIARKWGIPPGN